MDCEISIQSQSFAEPRSETQVLVQQKRGIIEAEEISESSHKRLKFGSFQSIFSSKAPTGRAENFHPCKSFDCLKSMDDSDCGSSANDKKDPMGVWKGLKQNHFMSTHHGPVPIPKSRSRKKNNNDLMKNKIELARKEKTDRFAILAAPSGLLNGLNPGIINHMRNSKQVHSIIEALVKSERGENRESRSFQIKKGDSFVERNEIGECASSGDSVYFKSEVISGDDDTYTGNGLGLQVENTSCLSNEEYANVTTATSLSVEAANVASQWLELLNQDIKGRLGALRRSKKRVRAVITTELPLLISREVSFDKAHFVRWSNLFEQMDKALYEEENHLASWLNQVKVMQLHCERGLCKSSLYHADPTGTDNRLGENDLDVSAAATSIYSTCNFLENYHYSANSFTGIITTSLQVSI